MSAVASGYPAGAEDDPRAPYNEPMIDDVCGECGEWSDECTCISTSCDVCGKEAESIEDGVCWDCAGEDQP
jgi:hypothetical protein